MMISGGAAWQRAYNFADKSAKNDLNMNEYNSNFVSDSKDLVTACIWILTIQGLILDILCIKWLNIASFLFYLELMYTVMTAMFPYASGIAASQ